MVKKGDTLIEVAIAIGIFSMIAVSVASVISSSTSGAQLSLETTLTREEVDTQAETLRFVHNAYISEADNAEKSNLAKLWETITSNAVTLSEIEDQNDILQYSPSSCSELYNDSSPTYKYAFVLDPRNIQNGNAYIKMDDSRMIEASTYPRLVYTENEQNLLDNSNNLYSAEGIYVIAVKDQGTTSINGEKTSAYYDFYIRTCWYGTGNEEPSTISTVIRLHNPDIIINNSGTTTNQ